MAKDGAMGPPAWQTRRLLAQLVVTVRVCTDHGSLDGIREQISLEISFSPSSILGTRTCTVGTTQGLLGDLVSSADDVPLYPLSAQSPTCHVPRTPQFQNDASTRSLLTAHRVSHDKPYTLDRPFIGFVKAEAVQSV